MRLLTSLLANPLEIWGREHFEELVVDNTAAFGRRVVVSDPDAIKRVLVDNAGNYLRDALQQRILLRTTGRSLFSAEGAHWQWERRLLAPLFTRKQLADYASGMAEAAAAAAVRLARLGASGPFDLSIEMARVTLDVLARTILPDALDEELSDVARSIRAFANGVGAVSLADLLGMPPWIPGIRRLRAVPAVRSVERRARRIIARARARGGPASSTDMIAVLLAARHPDTGQGLPEVDIEGNISTFLGAGSDTVASALTWSIYLLAQSPAWREAVERELDSLVAGRPIDLDLVDRLPLTRAVIEEAMRLYPPAPLLSRMALENDILCGRAIGAGTVVMISPWLVHRHRRLWDEPLVFDPRRFLPERRDAIRRFSYLPFGAGPRICIGMNFAMQEAVIVFACLLGSLRISAVAGPPVRLLQCVTLKPKDPLMMHCERRSARMLDRP